jgi:hypothetical protein
VIVQVPDIVASWGLPALLSLMDRVALKGPKTVGAAVTSIVHDEPAATLVLQLFF